MRRSLMAGALALVSFLPFRAQATEGCISIDAATTALTESGAAYATLDGDRKARALALYNLLAPPPHTAWTVVVVALLPDGSVELGFGLGTEMCLRMLIAPRAAQRALKAIYGIDA